MRIYFVTGATGVVGSAVVARLLADPLSRVTALIRASSPGTAGARLGDALAKIGAPVGTMVESGRLSAICGDVEQDGFGLPPLQYDALSSTCTHVIHCAGAVRMNLPLAAARRAAVDSVRNILELARGAKRSGQLAKIELVSTVGVAGYRYPILREQWVEADGKFHNTYEQAKAEAEQLARGALESGLPLTVHRPSMVVGDSRTGEALHFQVFYFLAEFLSGRQTGGFFPDLGMAKLDIVPVDFVAEAIAKSATSDQTTGAILHLCAGSEAAISLRELQSAVREIVAAGGEWLPKEKYLDRRLFRAATRTLALFAGANKRRRLATLPVFLDYLNTEQSFDNMRTRAWLGKAGIAMPVIREYLPVVLKHYFSSTSRTRTPHGSGKTSATAA